MTKKPKIELGDRVAFSAAWLRSTGNYTGSIPAMRGEVVEFHEFGSACPRLAKVAWDDGAPSSVLETNLARVGSAAMNAA